MRVPEIRFAAPYPADEVWNTGGTYYDSWLPPTNADQIDAGLDNTGLGGLTFRPRARKGVVFEYYRLDGQVHVHVLDLSGQTGLQCRLDFRPGQGAPSAARLLTLAGSRDCAITEQSGGLFQIDIEDEDFDTYGILRLEMR